MNQIFAVAQFRNHRETILPTMSMLLLIGLTIAYIPFLERTFGNICEHLPLTGEDYKKNQSITEDLVHKQTHLLQVLQPIETAPIVFARLENEDANSEDTGSNNIHTQVSENDVISVSTFTKSVTSVPESAPAPLSSIPIIHHSNVNEPRSYEIVPLILSGPPAATFDPYDVDFLTDRSFIKVPYSHPCMLDHSQVIMLPAKLPALMKVVLNYPSIEAFQQKQPILEDQSPIIMGESAVSEPDLNTSNM